MRRAITTLRILFGLCLAALAMTAPAAAWDAHALLHASHPVAVDDHHHHADDGRVLAHNEHGVPADSSEDEGEGHDHMPSLGASLSVTLATAPAPFLPSLVSELRVAPVPGLRLGIPDPPPARPPRSA